MIKLTCIVLILTLIYEIDAYKFLIVFPIPYKSHFILGNAAVEHLAKAGHEVTFITASTPEYPPPNVTVIDVSDKFNESSSGGSINLKALMDTRGDINSIFTYVPMVINMYQLTLEHREVQKLLADKDQHFDAIILEWVYTELYAGFAGLFNRPLIWYSTLEPHWMILQLIDEIPNPAYTVDVLSYNVPPLTFKQRIVELYNQVLGRLLQIFWISRLQTELYEQLFVPWIRNRRSSIPSLENLKQNTSLVLSNSHPAMGTAHRLPPNFISIGGNHIDTNVKPLPEALQKLMDNSKHGVIYFSMGSNLRSKSFPDEVKREFLNVFGKLKQTVIWKFEENLPYRPANVHILQWAPQQSILAHKNCILFITHGILLSTTETIHFGVPTIAIPSYGDQFVNVERAVKKGFARKVDLSYNMAAELEVTIQEMMNNTKYTNKAKELSQIYHDRPIPPSKELVHWVEHVVKTQGATHLRSAAFVTPWYQKLYLDLIICLLIVFLVLKSLIIFIKNKILRQMKQKINKKIN